MKREWIKRSLSIIITLSILLSFSTFFVVSAAEQKGCVFDVGADGLRVRTGPGTNHSQLVYNDTKVRIYDGEYVTVLEKVNSSNNDAYNPHWYKIKFSYAGRTLEGYVSTRYIKLIDDSDVIMPGGVPKEYETYIKTLLAQHPNWKFVFYDTGIYWNDLFSLNAQGYLGRSLIPYNSPISYRSTQEGAFDWRSDKWIAQDSGQWYQANAQTIAYYMDPRNFLTEANVFMFEQLSFDKSTHNIDGVNAILNDSFMENGRIVNLDGKNVTYSQAFMDAANYSNVSPYHLSSRSLQEVGKNGSGSVSGTRPGYEGYYNFYNIGAYQGKDPIANGLEFAKTGGSMSAQKKKDCLIPWNSQYRSILGGAYWIGSSYINKGQDTLYYQKFNTATGVYGHQYMGNIMAPKYESAKIRDSYNNLGILDNSFTFIVPYYRNMPSSPCQLPPSNNYSPNNWLKSLNVGGYSFGFDSGKTSGYSITVPSKTATIDISATPINANAKVNGVGTVPLKMGNNTVDIVVTAQNGAKRTYTIVITRSDQQRIPMTGIQLSAPSISLLKGDSMNLTVSYLPSTTTDDRTVTWSTSDSKVATVSNGKVTAVGNGTAVITAKVGSFQKTCKVTVVDSLAIGDIDADSTVTISDALMIFKYKTGEIALSQPAMKAADTDRNGKVELSDALKIFKYKSGEIAIL